MAKLYSRRMCAARVGVSIGSIFGDRGLADRNVYNQATLSPAGRRPKMPAGPFTSQPSASPCDCRLDVRCHRDVCSTRRSARFAVIHVTTQMHKGTEPKPGTYGPSEFRLGVSKCGSIPIIRTAKSDRLSQLVTGDGCRCKSRTGASRISKRCLE